jgi:hypothetical protein
MFHVKHDVPAPPRGGVTREPAPLVASTGLEVTPSVTAVG